MNQQQEIAKRVAALREDKGMTPAQAASETGTTEQVYQAYENGSADIPMGWLSVFARCCGVPVTSLLTGSDPHAHVYYVTRKGTGPVVERRNEYHYEGLAAQFAGKIMTPFVVTVEPGKKSDVSLNTHPGNEFNFVLSGKLLLRIAGQELALEKGDSIYFDSSKEHGMAALDGNPVTFLAIITDTSGGVQ